MGCNRSITGTQQGKRTTSFRRKMIVVCALITRFLYLFFAMLAKMMPEKPEQYRKMTVFCSLARRARRRGTAGPGVPQPASSP
jgi:hypothetical protein